MKTFYTIGILTFALTISQQIFPQTQNTKSPLTDEQQIELSEGYSFISSRIVTSDPDMLAVLAVVLNENLDFIRNSQGQVLRKIGPNWVNGIGDWIIEEGYLVKMFTADSFIIEGYIVDPANPIQLEAGFQFISYFPENPMDAIIAFETILGDDLDYIRNSQGQILRKIGSIWVNGIGDCNPGEGYLVKMNTSNVLVYPIAFGVPCPGIPAITYEGQVYNTVLIGEQCWLKENLNIGTMINGNEEMTENGVIEKYCYDNNITNCETYGGLYQWNEMMQYTTKQGVQGICPIGWHTPTDEEWKILEGTVDSQYPVGDPIWNQTGTRGYDAGEKLKSTTGWYSGGNGTNDFGFTALPGGHRNSVGNFNMLTSDDSFWSSSEGSINNAWGRALHYGYDGIHRNLNTKAEGFSVRCLQD
ncbi:MAG: hypothetical protein JEY97_16235 [Bacteroidales bacterium]|nr:hypothetical protein [Bacteroidales bacterium]